MKHPMILALTLMALAGCTASQAPSTAERAKAANTAEAPSVPTPEAVGTDIGAMATTADAQANTQPLPEPAELPKPHTDMVSMKSPHITVYKTATCGCCEAWVKHMEQDGFVVETRNEADLNAFKDRMGVPGPLRSCHTAEIEGLFVEGHVPAEDVRAMLARSQKDKDLQGIAVPGMPAGSPGMEMGDVKHPYEVIAVSGNGKPQEVFAKH